MATLINSSTAPAFLEENTHVADVAQGVVFTPEECDEIIRFSQQYKQENAAVHTAGTDTKSVPEIRRNAVSWIPHSEKSAPLFDRIQRIASDANKNFWKLDIHGFNEPIQFTHYRGGGDHYDWHLDVSRDKLSTRKLSVVVQLSDPSSYEGGDLEVQSTMKITAVKNRGNIVIFPSILAHRVKPITLGERYSLVVWLAGPPFR